MSLNDSPVVQEWHTAAAAYRVKNPIEYEIWKASLAWNEYHPDWPRPPSTVSQNWLDAMIDAEIGVG